MGSNQIAECNRRGVLFCVQHITSQAYPVTRGCRHGKQYLMTSIL